MNKHDYLPGVKLGLRIFDTCHDGITVFRQVLRALVEQSYAPDYEMGVLLPSRYGRMMDHLRDHGSFAIGVYEARDLATPAIDVLAHYISTRYEVVDLVHANAEPVLSRFLNSTKDAGVCVKKIDKHVSDANFTETIAVVVGIGEKDDVLRWLKNAESKAFKETWLLLPLDESDIDDLMPPGSYVVKSEVPRFDAEFSDEFFNNSDDSASRSPYFLDIGKAVIGLAEVFRDVRERSCDIESDGTDVATRISKTRREIRDSDVYETLRVQPQSTSVRYVVALKTPHGLVNVALYEISMPELRILPKETIPEKPRLCLDHLVKNCENCTNFQDHPNDVAKVDVVDGDFLKGNIYVTVFLTAVVCGALACCAMVTFIAHCLVNGKILDGNPALTIGLVLADLFTLLAAIPFCMGDDYFGADNLNAWKILLTTLAFGLTLSIMLSRALFLVLSRDGVFIVHINGYLQSLMAFFMFAVQVAMSTMYFSLNPTSSAITARSLTFIALLGYDIFLLIGLLVACYFIFRTQRNYYEGNCFLAAAVGLSIIWAMWIMCFALMQPKSRDAIVLFSIIATAYLIIFSVLVPRIYFMVVHTPSRKNPDRKFDFVNPSTSSIVNTIVKQSCSPHNYVYPARDSQTLQVPAANPNYYGSSSPNAKYQRDISPNRYEISMFNNYERHADIREIDGDYVTPRLCIENTKSLATNEVIYAQPKVYKSQRVVLGEKSSAQVIRNKDNSSPSPRLHVEMYPMRYTSPNNLSRKRVFDEEEEDEANEDMEEEENGKIREDDCSSRVTRF
ncbi:hypothetical protein PUN28_011491 [Cardiocondyla obscurior]